jgi:hypothetical protein
MNWPDVIFNWGTTAAERELEYGCEGLVTEPDQLLFRGVDVAAPVATTFRWLCQLRGAPYSYDNLDNRGRQSPQQLTPGLEQLEVGQRVCTIFKLVAFEPGRSLTVITKGGLFGKVACTYRAEPHASDPGSSRILVKFEIRYPRTLAGALMRGLLPAGDLVMMRRQLLNLAGLAERTAADERALHAAPLLDLRDQLA